MLSYESHLKKYSRQLRKKMIDAESLLTPLFQRGGFTEKLEEPFSVTSG